MSNHADIDENSIFVVSCDWKLWNLHLTLLQVDDDLKIEFELFLTINWLLESHLGSLKFLNNVLFLSFKEHDEVPQITNSVLVLRF